jgi:sporulation protein YlmC with PRC-barrel domain|tara:strand:+ start:106 stop:348 length:243 start_codon:yes stop_codon:yes gene_type:complete
MRTTFGKEILTRKVVDAAGDLLGHLADFTVDLGTGNIVSILVVAESGIDPNELPWPTTEGLLSIPVEEVASIGSVVELSR